MATEHITDFLRCPKGCKSFHILISFYRATAWMVYQNTRLDRRSRCSSKIVHISLYIAVAGI
jgi:hypothetical protein